jgi:hypothetical protein
MGGDSGGAAGVEGEPHPRRQEPSRSAGSRAAGSTKERSRSATRDAFRASPGEKPLKRLGSVGAAPAHPVETVC